VLRGRGNGVEVGDLEKGPGAVKKQERVNLPLGFVTSPFLRTVEGMDIEGRRWGRSWGLKKFYVSWRCPMPNVTDLPRSQE